MSKGFFGLLGWMRRWYSATEEVPVVSTRYTLIGTDDRSHELVGTRSSPSGFYADELDDMLVESPGATALNLFSTPKSSFLDNSSEWNTDCWANSLDFTGTPHQSLTAAEVDDLSPVWRTGTLVSPRHGLIAFHSWTGAGAGGIAAAAVDRIVIWIDADGNSYRRTLLGISDEIGAADEDLCIAYFGLPGTDAGVVATDPDLPSAIANYRVLPLDYRNYAPSFPEFDVEVTPQPTTGDPIIYLDQEWKVLVRDWYQVWQDSYGIDVWSIKPTEGNRPNYFEPLIPGDSSHPYFVLMNGELVLLSSHYRSSEAEHDRSESPFTTAYIDEVNAAMTDLETEFAGSGETTGYQLDEWEPEATPSTEVKLKGTDNASHVLTGV